MLEARERAQVSARLRGWRAQGSEGGKAEERTSEAGQGRLAQLVGQGMRRKVGVALEHSKRLVPCDRRYLHHREAPLKEARRSLMSEVVEGKAAHARGLASLGEVVANGVRCKAEHLAINPRRKRLEKFSSA